MAEKCKTNHDSENKMKIINANKKKTLKNIRKHNNIKHYNKSENTMTNLKTKQVRKHNDKSDKPENVGKV